MIDSSRLTGEDSQMQYIAVQPVRFAVLHHSPCVYPAFRVSTRLAVLPKPVLLGVTVKKSSNASSEIISARLPGAVLQNAE